MDAINRYKMTLTMPSDVEFALERAFDAPRELVFRAWTEPKHLSQWYGCVSQLTKCDVDLTVNGGYRYTMGAAGAQPITRAATARPHACPAMFMVLFRIRNFLILLVFPPARSGRAWSAGWPPNAADIGPSGACISRRTQDFQQFGRGGGRAALPYAESPLC